MFVWGKRIPPISAEYKPHFYAKSRFATRDFYEIQGGTDSSIQVNEPVAKGSGENAEDNAEGDIESEHQEVS